MNIINIMSIANVIRLHRECITMEYLKFIVHSWFFDKDEGIHYNLIIVYILDRGAMIALYFYKEILEQYTGAAGGERAPVVADSPDGGSDSELRSFKSEEELLAHEVAISSYISSIVNRVNSGSSVPFMGDAVQLNGGYSYRDFLADHGLSNFDAMDAGDRGMGVWILYHTLEAAKQKSTNNSGSESYFYKMRKTISSSISTISRDWSSEDRNLMLGTMPHNDTDSDYLYNARKNSDKKYLIAMFRLALLYTPDMRNCPLEGFESLCSNQHIISAYNQTTDRLLSLGVSSQFNANVERSTNQGHIMTYFKEYLENSGLQNRYGFSIKVTPSNPDTKSFGSIAIYKKDNNGSDAMLWNPISQHTTCAQLFPKDKHSGYHGIFDPMRIASESRLESITGQLLQSYGSTRAPAVLSTEAIQQFIGDNDDDIGFMEIFHFMNAIKNNQNHSLRSHINQIQNHQQKKLLEGAINTFNPGFFTLEGLQTNIQGARDMLFSSFLPLYALFFQKQFESKQLSSAVSHQLDQADNQLSQIHAQLAGNMGVDISGNPQVEYPDEELRKTLDAGFISLGNSMHEIDMLNLAPGALIDPTILSRYRKTMAKLFLAMSGLDPHILESYFSHLPAEELNIYSAIMKNGGRPHAQKYVLYFQEYVNTLNESQLYELANGFFMVSYMTGNDDYDPMEKMMLSSVSTLIYSKISDRLLEKYAEKRREWELCSRPGEKSMLKAQLDRYYDGIVQFYRIISGRKDTSYSDDKFQKEDGYSYSFTSLGDLLLLPLGGPGLKYFTHLYAQADRIGNLRDDSLLGTDVALSGLEKLFRISGAYDSLFEPQISVDTNGKREEFYNRRLANLKGYTIPNTHDDEAIRNKKLTNIGMELENINAIDSLPRGEEHFCNKLMELGFMNLAMDHFKPDGYGISSLIEKAKNGSADGSIQCMKFYQSLTQSQLAELCLLRMLCKENTQLSRYLGDEEKYGRASLDNEGDKQVIQSIAGMSDRASFFQRAFDELIKGVMLENFKSGSDRDSPSTNAGVSLYYNIVGDKSVSLNWHSIVFGNASDASIHKQRGYTKTAAIIAGGIAVGLVTFGAGAAAMGGAIVGLKAVGLALAVGATTTAYGHTTRQDGYVNPDDVYADLGSQFFVNSATAFIGMQYLSPGMGNLSAMQSPAFSTALKYAIADGVNGFGGELLRQNALASCTDVKAMDRIQIRTMGGMTLLMSLISPMVSRIAQRKMQGMDIDADELRAIQSGIDLIDANNKIQIIDDMIVTLRRNGMAEDRARSVANRMRTDRERAKAKLTELNQGIYAPKDSNSSAFDFSSIDSPLGAHDFIQSLTSSEDGIALLRIFMAAEIDEQVARFPLREQIANIGDNEKRSEIGKMLHVAFGGTAEMREKGGKNAMQSAHDVPPTGSDASYTHEDMLRKIAILRAAVENGHLTEGGMRALLRLNVCGELNVGHWVEKLFEKCCLRPLARLRFGANYQYDNYRFFSDNLGIDVYDGGKGYQIKTTGHPKGDLTSNTNKYRGDIFRNGINKSDIRIGEISAGMNSRLISDGYVLKPRNNLQVSFTLGGKNVVLMYFEGTGRQFQTEINGVIYHGMYINNFHCSADLDGIRSMYLSMLEENSNSEWFRDEFVFVQRGTGPSGYAGIIPKSGVVIQSGLPNGDLGKNFGHIVEIGGFNGAGARRAKDRTTEEALRFELGTKTMKNIIDVIQGNLKSKLYSKQNLMKLISDIPTGFSNSRYVLEYSHRMEAGGQYVHEFRVFEIFPSVTNADKKVYIGGYSVFPRDYK